MWDKWLTSICHRSLVCLLSAGFSLVVEVFSSTQSHLFAFFVYAFGVVSQKAIAKTNIRKLFPCFLPVILQFWVLHFLYYIWVALCVRFKVQFYFFACGCGIFPAPFTEETIFLILCSCHSCWRSVNNNAWITWAFYMIPLFYMSIHFNNSTIQFWSW